MSYISTKKLLTGALAAALLVLQVPMTALAATDEEVLAATQAGVQYLADSQDDDGSIPGPFGGETDWTIIAVEAAGEDADELENGSGVSAVDYIETEATADATDVARRMLAIASTEGDSTDFGGTDYNALLATYHTDGQIGDEAFLNDDTFAIMAIEAAGDVTLYAAAQDSLNVLLANQDMDGIGLDGGFTGGTPDCAWCVVNSNDTATAIIAMKSATKIGLPNDLSAAQAAALNFLLSTQRDDGGFIFSPVYDSPDYPAMSDGSSTAWALMALNAVGAGVETQAMAARNWLLTNQNDDGGFSYGAGHYPGSEASSTTITADAIIALLGSTWLLDPAPLQGEAPVVPEIPTEENEEEEAIPVVTASAKKTPVQSETTADDAEVLMTTTSTPVEEKSTPEKKETVTTTPVASSTPVGQYAIYAALILGALFLGWYAFRPKAKPGKA